MAPAGIKTNDKNENNHCAFCGRRQHEVDHLIEGQMAFICNECAILCVQRLGYAVVKGPKPATPAGQHSMTPVGESPTTPVGRSPTTPAGRYQPPPAAGAKLADNAACHCGSGKKYKFCHGKKAN